MVAIKRAIEPYQRQQAKERRRTLHNEETASGNLPQANKGNALVKIAGFVGVSRPTLQTIKEID